MLRYLHVADVMLDCPPEGTIAFQQIPNGSTTSRMYREELRRATITTFERIIESCVDHEVDFLLLTGDSFVENDHSLLARSTLLDGFQALEEVGIAVFVVPGEKDGIVGWERIPHLPGNVTVLKPGMVEPVSFVLANQRVATLTAFATHRAGVESASSFFRFDRSNDEVDDGPFRIGIAQSSTVPEELASEHSPDEHYHDAFPSVHYVALYGSGQRRSFARNGISLHDPGAVQGLSAHQTGEHGATLVDVNAEGTIRLSFLPLAALRWATCTLDADEDCEPITLIEQMGHYLQHQEFGPHDNLAMVTWRVQGTGRYHLSLHYPETCERLLEEYAELLQDEEPSIPLLHRFVVVTEQHNLHGGEIDGQSVDSILTVEFLSHLEELGHQFQMEDVLSELHEALDSESSLGVEASDVHDQIDGPEVWERAQLIGRQSIAREKI